MGRTNPTFRDRLTALEDDWASFRRGLRHQDQQPFDRLWDDARAHADAGGLQNAPDPMHTVLLSICLEQEKAIAALEARVDDHSGAGSRGFDRATNDAVDFLENNEILAPGEVDGIPLDKLNDLRNPLTHFRPPVDSSRLSRRTVDELPEDIGAWEASFRLLKNDAEEVLKTMFSVTQIFGIGSELE